MPTRNLVNNTAALPTSHCSFCTQIVPDVNSWNRQACGPAMKTDTHKLNKHSENAFFHNCHGDNMQVCACKSFSQQTAWCSTPARTKHLLHGNWVPLHKTSSKNYRKSRFFECIDLSSVLAPLCLDHNSGVP